MDKVQFDSFLLGSSMQLVNFISPAGGTRCIVCFFSRESAVSCHNAQLWWSQLNSVEWAVSKVWTQARAAAYSGKVNKHIPRGMKCRHLYLHAATAKFCSKHRHTTSSWQSTVLVFGSVPNIAWGLGFSPNQSVWPESPAMAWRFSRHISLVKWGSGCCNPSATVTTALQKHMLTALSPHYNQPINLPEPEALGKLCCIPSRWPTFTTAR